MKTAFLSVCAVVLFANVAIAANTGTYSQAGCGLGSMIIGSEKGFTQVFAATTNGTFGNQTFGISSGTSNCDKAPRVASLPAFSEANRLALANDIARGNGETLVSLSETLGCSDVGHLSSVLQKNYGSIFPAATVNGEKISESILNVVNNDAALAKTCNAKS